MSVEASLYDAIRDAVKAGDQTLEFGSGLSTFGFSSPQTTHIAIESDSYQANLINMCFGCALYVPLDSNGWYKMPVDPIVQGKADVILVDGPSAAEGGDRLQGMENILSYAKENTIIFVDDVHRENEIQLARGLAHRLDRQIRYKDRWAKI